MITLKLILESVVCTLVGLCVMLFFAALLLLPESVLMAKWRAARDWVWNVDNTQTVAGGK